MTYAKDRDEPIYTISIAAKLVRPPPRPAPGAEGSAAKHIHAQTLRMYDRIGLVRPRKVGKNRFYSDRDIERLRQIQHFTQDIGINLAGVAYIFALVEQMERTATLTGRPDAMLQLDAMLQEAERRLRDTIKDEAP